MINEEFNKKIKERQNQPNGLLTEMMLYTGIVETKIWYLHLSSKKPLLNKKWIKKIKNNL
jgi:hypothetical protein